MTAFLAGPGGDPARLHAEGRAVRGAVEDARAEVAALFGTRPRQVVFTSGATEAVNSAVWGAGQVLGGRPILLARVEHSCVVEASRRAGPVVELAVQRSGRLDLDALDEALAAFEAAPTRGTGPPAALVHCQAANHEVGVLQPLAEVVGRAHRAGAWVHVDAAAAAGHVPFDFDRLGADLASVSAHKLGGPAGTGALLVRGGLRLAPLLVGGDQERARRAGLENLPGIVGFGTAAAVLRSPGRVEEEAARAAALRDRLTEAALAVGGVTVLGHGERLPHLVALGVEGVEAEPVVLGLDQAGIAVHSGSACSSESLVPSPVLEAMGEDAERSLRLSVGWSTTDADVEAFAAAFGPVVGGLRDLRPAP